jgi:hypothetical protein
MVQLLKRCRLRATIIILYDHQHHKISHIAGVSDATGNKASSILVFLCDRQPILMEKTDILPALAGVELKLTVDNVFSWLKMA